MSISKLKELGVQVLAGNRVFIRPELASDHKFEWALNELLWISENSDNMATDIKRLIVTYREAVPEAV